MSNKSVSNELLTFNENYYAIVDLGSNSFHLLICQRKGEQFTAVQKVKNKVRLAAGLDEHNCLSEQAIQRGLACLQNFAAHLQAVPQQHISIVATATLRIAENSEQFIAAANKLLPVPIKLLTGEQEAETIYIGATCQQPNHDRQLILDIGGASTELIIGQQCKAEKVVSLNLGCVSFRQKFFGNDHLNELNFSNAIDAAKDIIDPICRTYKKLGWQSVMGSSGTMQALAEILAQRQENIIITRDFLNEIKQTLVACNHIDNIDFSGLRSDRKPVLASGLAILIALFECLDINESTLSTGALREGLLHKLAMIDS